MGPGAFRRRFGMLLHALGISKAALGQRRTLDLGSLRAGGATALFQSSGDAELARGRGRWLTLRTMMIYVQEVSSVSFLAELSAETRDHIGQAAELTSTVWGLAAQWSHEGVPPSLWRARFLNHFKNI